VLGGWLRNLTHHQLNDAVRQAQHHAEQFRLSRRPFSRQRE